MIDKPDQTDQANQPEKTKAEAFAEDPDRFIDSKVIRFALAVTPEGKIACMMNVKDTDEARRLIVHSAFELSKEIIRLDISSHKRIVRPGPDIRKFMNRFKR